MKTQQNINPQPSYSCRKTTPCKQHYTYLPIFREKHEENPDSDSRARQGSHRGELAYIQKRKKERKKKEKEKNKTKQKTKQKTKKKKKKKKKEKNGVEPEVNKHACCQVREV